MTKEPKWTKGPLTDALFQRYMNAIRTKMKKLMLGDDYGHGDMIYEVRPRIVCEDGFEFSCQAGWGKYSCPRRDDSTSYSEWELGFPSKPFICEEITGKSEGSQLTQTVYGYVPTSLIINEIERHGGIVKAALSKALGETE